MFKLYWKIKNVFFAWILKWIFWKIGNMGYIWKVEMLKPTLITNSYSSEYIQVKKVLNIVAIVAVM